jgi:hypothetical protein
MRRPLLHSLLLVSLLAALPVHVIVESAAHMTIRDRSGSVTARGCVW